MVIYTQLVSVEVRRKSDEYRKELLKAGYVETSEAITSAHYTESAPEMYTEQAFKIGNRIINAAAERNTQELSLAIASRSQLMDEGRWFK